MATTIDTDKANTAPETAPENVRDEPAAETAEAAPTDTSAPAPVKRKAAEPKGPGNRETLITGDQGPEISEEEQQRRAAILAAQMREIDEEDAQRAEEERRKKAADAPQGQPRELSRIGNIYARWGLGLNTHDNFLSVAAAVGEPSATPQMSNAQLKALILTAALEKNWHTLYLYKDRSTVDPALTSRAQQMIIELQREGQPLHGYHMRVSPVRMRDVEPWNQGRPLYGMFRSAANYKQDAVEGVKEGISTRWNSLVTGIMFADKNADAAPAATQAAETQAGKPVTAEGTTVRAGESPAEVAAETAARRANPGGGLGAGR